ncbi:MAG: hypothetical protein IJS32_00110 [Kiritimatiellae bacterium]|nr:hypothetical protein [Kiritimatiellia bacterium]
MERIAIQNILPAGFLALSLLAFPARAGEGDAGYILLCGAYRPEWAAYGIEPPPGWEAAFRHFLLAEDDPPMELPGEDWQAKIAGRDAALRAIESEKGFSAEWDRTFLETVPWRFPKGGDLETAAAYFTRKTDWVERMFQSGIWRHDHVHLEAAADVLGEIREWRFPANMLAFEDDPGRDVLLGAGVESPDDLPDEASRTAYRKCVERNARWEALSDFEMRLADLDWRLAREIWVHGNEALEEAEAAGAEEDAARLQALRRRVYDGTDADRRNALLRTSRWDVPVSPRSGSEKDSLGE